MSSVKASALWRLFLVTLQVPPLKLGVCLILEVHNMLLQILPKSQMNGKLNVKTLNSFNHAPPHSSVDQ